MSFQYSNPKVAGRIFVQNGANQGISTHSRLKAAGGVSLCRVSYLSVSTHSRLKAAGAMAYLQLLPRYVSTHSRLKAAGGGVGDPVAQRRRFNTQPPEGGWNGFRAILHATACFNTQPPEGGWEKVLEMVSGNSVSTHSRLKAAGFRRTTRIQQKTFQHTAA